MTVTTATATAMTTAGGTAEIGIVKIMTILGAGGMMANEKNASQRAVTANAKLETAVTAVIRPVRTVTETKVRMVASLHYGLTADDHIYSVICSTNATLL